MAHIIAKRYATNDGKPNETVKFLVKKWKKNGFKKRKIKIKRNIYGIKKVEIKKVSREKIKNQIRKNGKRVYEGIE